MADKLTIIDIIRAHGLLMPETENEVREFELHYKVSPNLPDDWENPLAILQRGPQDLTEIKMIDEDDLDKDISSLGMAARKGSDLPQYLIEKMKKQHRNEP